MARRSSRETLKRDRIARLENQKAAALRAAVKLLTIVNGLESLYRHVEETIAHADAAGHGDMEIWQKVRPMVGFTDKMVRFESEEIAVFVTEEAGYLNELLLLAERYAALESGFKAYAERRSRLTDELSAVMSGSVGTTSLTKAQYEKFAPRAHELTLLIEQLRESVSADYETALTVAEQFGPKARIQLNDPTFPILSVDAARAKKESSSVAAR